MLQTVPMTNEPAAASPRRRRGTLLDMFRSLGLVALGVVTIMTLTFRNEPSHPPVTMDVQAVVRAARAEGPFPILAATTLPKDIYANAAYFDPAGTGHWRYSIGYTDGYSGYASVEATDATGDAQLKPPFPGATPKGTRSIAGIAFDVYAESEVQVWFHGATTDAPYAIQISCNALQSCDAIRASLSTEGTVATGEAATTS